MKFKLFSSILMLLSSCSPYLSSKSTGSAFFATNERCSKGPFNIKTFTLGSKWGERLKITMWSKHDFKFNVTVFYGDQKPVTTTYGTENHKNYCIINREKINVTNPNRFASTKTPFERTTARFIHATYSMTQPIFSSSPKIRDKFKSKSIIIYDHKVDSKNKNPFKKSVPVKITIWSNKMADFKDVIFQINQSKYIPSNEKKWQKQLK